MITMLYLRELARPVSMNENDNQRELHETFERIVVAKRYGFRFDTNTLRPEQGVRTTLQRCKRNAEKWFQAVREQHCPRMGPVHFDYVENTNVNAVAFEADGHEFVGIWIGTVLTIHIFLGCLLANQHLLPSIGAVSEEVEFEPEGSDVAWLTRIPKDPARRSYAHLLSEIAVEFLFRHELAHLMNGHVRLLNKWTGTNFLVEFDEHRCQAISNLGWQTLEMDADSFAVGQGIATVLGRLKEPD
jgi:hypothetical protein